MKFSSLEPNGFDAPIQNKKVAQKLKSITNDYDLLCFIKNNISFFLDSQLINAEWFSRFDPDTLKELHIYHSGYCGVEVKEKDISIIVIDCNFDLKTFNDVAVNIRFYGKSYGSVFLNAGSSANIKVTGTTTLELYASDHSQSNVYMTCKSKSVIEAHKNSFVAVKNRSRSTVRIDKGEKNITIS